MKDVAVSTRYKKDWLVKASEEGRLTVPRMQLVVLCEIRDELQRLNRLLGCRNFLDIPTRLRAIDRSLKQQQKQKE